MKSIYGDLQISEIYCMLIFEVMILEYLKTGIVRSHSIHDNIYRPRLSIIGVLHCYG